MSEHNHGEEEHDHDDLKSTIIMSTITTGKVNITKSMNTMTKKVKNHDEHEHHDEEDKEITSLLGEVRRVRWEWFNYPGLLMRIPLCRLPYLVLKMQRLMGLLGSGVQTINGIAFAILLGIGIKYIYQSLKDHP